MFNIVVPECNSVPIHIAVICFACFSVSVLLNNILNCVKFCPAVLRVDSDILAFLALILLTDSRYYHLFWLVFALFFLLFCIYIFSLGVRLRFGDKRVFKVDLLISLLLGLRLHILMLLAGVLVILGLNWVDNRLAIFTQLACLALVRGALVRSSWLRAWRHVLATHFKFLTVTRINILNYLLLRWSVLTILFWFQILSLLLLRRLVARKLFLH